jgi:hypothetical protein
MYEVLCQWNEAPTNEEIEIAQNKKPLSSEAALDYLNHLEQLSQNIQDMFTQQSASQRVCNL